MGMRIVWGFIIFFCMLFICVSFFFSFSTSFWSLARIAFIIWERYSDVSFCITLYSSHPHMRVISKRLMPMFRNETATAVSIITTVANGISAMFNDTLFSSDYFVLIAYFGFSLITISWKQFYWVIEDDEFSHYLTKSFGKRVEWKEQSWEGWD